MAGDPIEPLALRFEPEGLATYPHLPGRLRRLYGGGIGLPRAVTVANLVASVDGVVALGPGRASDSSVISGRDPADRFVMGLLRACADAVLIGAGTLRTTPGHRWTPEQVCPWAAQDLAALRRGLGRDPRPHLVVVTRSGVLPGAHPALGDGTVVATVPQHAAELRAQHPALEVLAADPGDHVDLTQLVARLRARGWTTLLCEGGPLLVGELLRDGLLDELFLTVAPVLAGRRPDHHRPGAVDGLELLPHHRAGVRLMGLRQHRSTLFLRYCLSGAAATA